MKFIDLSFENLLFSFGINIAFRIPRSAIN
jgi:hypothetical protein